ncbi:uncharacterized protein LOC132396664 isoform X5 [Hypanus sabinus]|uniref:uncharacterized protein LOC132396664 isoform X5 n=1 Tax=Hypanus sabinus TaxID=79690 RepID=UPI0028C37D02|nr:uncharacterized protein LOC132396664 isoform X5 [Hypanus sabinus]
MGLFHRSFTNPSEIVILRKVSGTRPETSRLDPLNSSGRLLLLKYIIHSNLRIYIYLPLKPHYILALAHHSSALWNFPFVTSCQRSKKIPDFRGFWNFRKKSEHPEESHMFTERTYELLAGSGRK